MITVLTVLHVHKTVTFNYHSGTDSQQTAYMHRQIGRT